MANIVYLSKTLLTGGTAPALDSIDGAGLVDGDAAHVRVADVLYIYRLNATSGAGENSPGIIAPDTNAGTKRWIQQGLYAATGKFTDLTASLPIFTGASKELVSKSVADTRTALEITALGLLANGAADLKTFMNAAGSAPEWANGFKVGGFGRAFGGASGNVSYTGVGFKPSLIMFLCGIDGNTENMFSFGATTGAFSINIARGADTKTYVTGNPIYMHGGVYDCQSGTLASFDADGFTIAWALAGSPSGTITVNYIAFR